MDSESQFYPRIDTHNTMKPTQQFRVDGLCGLTTFVEDSFYNGSLTPLSPVWELP